MRPPGASIARHVLAIVQLPRVLGDIATSLQSIQAMVASLDDEVARMRRSVDGIRGTVEGVRDLVGPLDERLRDVHAGFDRLEPAITDIGRALRPWRRAGRAG